MIEDKDLKKSVVVMAIGIFFAILWIVGSVLTKTHNLFNPFFVAFLVCDIYANYKLCPTKILGHILWVIFCIVSITYLFYG